MESQKIIVFVDQNIPVLPHYFDHTCFELHYFNGRCIPEHVVHNADLLFIRSVTKINKETMQVNELLPLRLKGVASCTIGKDHVDEHFLESLGVSFFHAPGCNAQSVAEYDMSCILLYLDQMKKVWSDVSVSIIGYGNVGKSVASILKKESFKSLSFYDPYVSGLDDGVRKLNSLHEAFHSDIVLVHTPYTTTGDYPTHKMISKVILEHLNVNSMFLIAGRGGVLDEEALLGLQKSKSLWLAMDVWQNEPFINQDLLQSAQIATPHIAGYSSLGKINGTHQAAVSMHHLLHKEMGVCLNLDFDVVKENAIKSYMDVPLKVMSFPLLIEDIEDLLENDELKSKSKEIYTQKKKLYDYFNMYNPLSDTKKLKASLSMPIEKRAAWFDVLRKEYPIRYELSQAVFID